MAPRIPKRNAHFIDSDAEADRGRAVLEMLRGYAGAPSQASVMHPGALSAYEGGELAGMAEMLIPGASLAKGALGAALAGVIKPRGGNWIPRSVENSISELIERAGETDPTRLAALREQMGNPELGRSGEALGRWIEGPLTKYIKRDMATPEDPVRRLAEEDILHYTPGREFYRPDINIDRVRSRGGFPAEGVGVSDLARKWENVSDEMIVPSDVAKLRLRNALPDEDWINKLSDDSKMYSTLEPGYFKDSTGFGHLVDELSNSLNPDSGLPRNLLLRPEQMQQMGIEKAVRHVDAINKWRAAQQAASNAELANKAMIVREYAENNPKGLRWVELRPSETLNPEYELKRVEGKNGVYWDLRKPGESYGHTTNTELEAIRASNRAELEKQLKYEGDTMGHCVGGYCPDVLEGRSRIFSLRDAKGEPHVTIEVSPQNDLELAEQAEDMAYDRLGSHDHPDFERVQDEIFNQLLSGGDFSIAQIKGKQNLAPKEEYLPFVQDFVRNSPLGTGWSRVGDLKNTRLRDMRNLYGEEYPEGLHRFMTEKEQQQFNLDYPQVNSRISRDLDAGIDWEPDDGYAAGGIVEFPKITPKAMLNRVISAYNAL